VDRIVVVGAGMAGLRAAQTLRRNDFDGELILIGDESHRPYDRPPLTKEVLRGDMEPGECAFSSDDLDVSWKLESRATGLDVADRVVRLDDGDEVNYDGLVITTGRRARAWPDAPELDGLHMLRRIDDSVALRDALADSPRLAIVGAGFIGCEVAATARRRGVEEVTLIDVAERPMPPLGQEASDRARQLHEQHGVRLLLGESVEGFEGSERVEAVRLEGGQRVEADVVVIAVGSTPNSEWLQDSGLEMHHGCVLCDTCCFAEGADNVVAAGDIAAWPHPLADGPVWVEHWSNAQEMASAAAKNLLAEPADRKAYEPVPTFWSDQYDVKIKSVGFVGLADHFEVVEEDQDKWRLVIEAHRGGDLVGAVTFNKNRAFTEYLGKLKEQAVSPSPR
jgi:NADPH-dependent 2,4-dienoyl-CoA reductase/sulfur reductase-like enzyme